jgi:hypothetical protein
MKAAQVRAARWRRSPLVLTERSMTPGLGPKASEPEMLCWDMNALPDPPPLAGHMHRSGFDKAKQWRTAVIHRSVIG